MKSALALTALALLGGTHSTRAEEAPRLSAELVFPLHHEHNHAPGIAELADGYFVEDDKSMKHAAFNEAWVLAHRS